MSGLETPSPSSSAQGSPRKSMANRIRLTLVVLIALTLVAVGAGFTALLSQGRASERMTEHISNSTLQTAHIEGALSEFQLQATLGALSPNPAEKKAATDAIGPARQELAGVVDSVNATELAATSEWKEFHGAYTEFFRITDEEINPVLASGEMPTPDMLTRLNEQRGVMFSAAHRLDEVADAQLVQMRDENGADSTRMMVLLALLGIVSMAVGGWMGARLSRSFTKALEGLHPAVLALGRGDFTVPAEKHGDDELAQMAGAVNRARGELSSLMGDVRARTDSLERSIDEIAAQVDRVGGSAAGSSRDSAAAATTAANVSENVQTVAAGTEEMTASIREISTNATERCGGGRRGHQGRGHGQRHGDQAGRVVAGDRRGHQDHHEHRRADQPARAQRHHRGGPCG